ncbi:hypothetical protein BWGOE13_38190 [Bacillus mycoides]|uniref:Uncharacterized protein n=1 Tax=Bacillus mycoides TaxID=1405 RepID=A0A1E8BK92_BACMY|nr:hypothetical protein BWGOE11_38920 [Bacillus mycoides]OFD95219.1 hypothetical protein BWGOE13_38190 [Bacillus mycoides]
MKVVRSIFKGFRLMGLIVKPILKALSKSKF